MLHDVRYAFRTLRLSPGFAAAAVVSMTLGIGANTAIFSLIHTLVWRPLPVVAAHELVEPVSWLPESDAPRANAFAWRHFTHYRDHTRTLSALIAVSSTRLRVGSGDAVGTIDAEYVAGPFFTTLGLRPAAGRLLEGSDDAADAPGVAVISWDYWQRRFNKDPSVLGSALLLNGAPATIVGVAPRGFFGLQVGLNPDLWVPVGFEPRTQQPSRLTDRSLPVKIMGRLRAGVSREQAEADMRLLDRERVVDLVKTAPFWRRVQLHVEPAAAGFGGVRDLIAGPLKMLMAIAVVLLLLACANVAALLLARASAREHEIAVRVAVGAGRGRLFRQLLTESLVLSGIGGALGILVAIAGGNLLVRMLLSGRLPPGFPASFSIQVQPDWPVLVFAVSAVVVTGMLLGLAPAVHAWSTSTIGALRAATAGAEHPRRRRFGHALVATQVALSVALLTAAGLLVSHVLRLKDVDTGVQRDHMLLATIDPSKSGYERPQLFLPYRTLLERLDAMPGVQAATVSAVTPVQGPGAARFVDVPGFVESAEAKKFIPMNVVGPRYFETYGTPVIAGREFSFDDIGQPRVAIVNQAMARYYFGAETPIGKRFSFTGRDGVYEIVGLVADAKYQSLTEQAAPRTIYVHAFQETRMLTDRLSIRTTEDSAAVAADVRLVVDDVLKSGATANITTLDRQMDASIVMERTIAVLAACFGGLGALLAAVGLYGLMAYTVTRRTREIGIRVALGATRRDIVSMVLRGAGILLAMGMLAGAPLALWGQRVAAQALPNFTVAPSAPMMVAALEIAIVALAAAYLPARRAARIDPMAALKQD